MQRAEIEDALERLHRDSYAWTLVCCRGDRDEAQEVLQAAYLKVLDGRARFAGRSAFKTWLFAVIRRTQRARRRREVTRQWLLGRWAGDAPAPAGAANPERSAADGQQAARIRDALATLSLRQRQVLELVFYHDLTVREAARVIGVTVGTARVHYDRGKRELSNRLEALGWG